MNRKGVQYKINNINSWWPIQLSLMLMLIYLSSAVYVKQDKGNIKLYNINVIGNGYYKNYLYLLDKVKMIYISFILYVIQVIYTLSITNCYNLQ